MDSFGHLLLCLKSYHMSEMDFICLKWIYLFIFGSLSKAQKEWLLPVLAHISCGPLTGTEQPLPRWNIHVAHELE